MIKVEATPEMRTRATELVSVMLKQWPEFDCLLIAMIAAGELSALNRIKMGDATRMLRRCHVAGMRRRDHHNQEQEPCEPQPHMKPESDVLQSTRSESASPAAEDPERSEP